MVKFCTNCGKEVEENFNVCPHCGTPVYKNINNNVVNNPRVIINKRSIGVAILLSIITCGIYGIYWFITLTDEANKVSGHNAPSGGTAFLFTLLTCGIYSIYWSYKMGEKMYEAGKMHGKDIENNSILYLILSILGLGIINYCLIQSSN